MIKILRINRYVFLFVLGIAASGAGPTAHAQTRDTMAARGPLFTWRDAIVTGVFAAATIGLVQYDAKIAHYIARPEVQSDKLLREIDRDFGRVNEASLFLAGTGVYIVSKIAHAPTAADMAFHATEAVVISTVANTALRGVLGRSRPFVSGGDDPRDFHFGKGFSDFDYRSLPSIHASSNYAAATVIVGEVHERWPDAAWWVAPPLYVVASLPSVARLHGNRHWASDILSGAFLGTFTGIKVIQYHHPRHANFLDRIFLHATVTPGVVGASLDF
ncbi:MAG: phosphatase PAP2 family protein [Gemmatimonadaceae bacterium]